jgi:hypothetical protein
MIKVLPRLIIFMVAFTAAAQPKKQFAVEGKRECSRVVLNVGAESGNYIIRPTHSAEVLNVYSQGETGRNPFLFEETMSGSVQQIMLKLNDVSGRGMTRILSEQMMGDENSEGLWKVYLTDNKPYRLNMDYDLGNSNIDLSGLSIERLNINTGSAEIRISYDHGENKTEMDTFQVKVELGSVALHKTHQARSRFVAAEVGFGKMFLDFSDKPLVDYVVYGIVGAGNLIVNLPDDEVPVLIRINDSWLSSVMLPRNYRQVGDNAYASPAWTPAVQKPVVFNLDVAMGKIILRNAAGY